MSTLPKIIDHQVDNIEGVSFLNFADQTQMTTAAVIAGILHTFIGTDTNNVKNGELAINTSTNKLAISKFDKNGSDISSYITSFVNNNNYGHVHINGIGSNQNFSHGVSFTISNIGIGDVFTLRK